MDNPDRTCSSSIEIPEQLRPVLRDAAEEWLERACDNSGRWDEKIRAKVLEIGAFFFAAKRTYH